MSATFDNAQWQWDHASPREHPYANEIEHLGSVRNDIEAAIESYRASMDAFVRDVPREYRDLPQIRADIDGYIVMLEEMQVEYSGHGRLNFTKSG